MEDVMRRSQKGFNDPQKQSYLNLISESATEKEDQSDANSMAMVLFDEAA